MTVIAGQNYLDADYGRVAYLLLVWNGFVWNFLLVTPVIAPFQIINFVSALIYTYDYLKAGAPQAPSLKFGNDVEPVDLDQAAAKEAA